MGWQNPLGGGTPLPKARGSLTSHSRGKNVQAGRVEKEACGGLAGEGAATEGELGGLQHPPSPLPTWCCRKVEERMTEVHLTDLESEVTRDVGGSW